MPLERGWHPDPDAPGEQRYWDGRAWTRYTDDPPDLKAQTTGAAVRVSTLVRVGGAVVLVAVLALGGWFGWQKYSADKEADEIAQLADQVKDGLQDNLRTDDFYGQYGINVRSVKLNKVSENKYEGMATVDTAQSTEQHYVEIEVTNYDGDVLWRTEQGAFLFVVGQEPEQQPATSGSDINAEGVPLLRGLDASLDVQVDCGADGEANVRITFGVVDDTTYIVGGQDFARSFGMSAEYQDLPFTITTSPTKGICTTTLTDANTGAIIGQQGNAGSRSLQVIFTGKE